jgi:hypothetical protein
MDEEHVEPGLSVLSVPSDDRPAKLVDALLLVVVFLGAQAVLGVLLGLAQTLVSIAINNVVLSVLEAAAFAITILVMRKRLRSRMTAFMPYRNVKGRIYITAAIGGMGLLFLILPIEAGLMKLLPMPRLFKTTFAVIGNPEDYLGSLLLAAIVAPIIEETLFRGVVLRGFVQNYGIPKGLMLSAVIFGLVHLNPYQFVTGFLLGLFIGLVFIRSGSILPGMIVHALYNGALLSGAKVSYALKKTLPSHRSGSDIGSTISAVCLGVALTTLGVWLFLRATRQNQMPASVRSNE